jgi:hypothetical protein
MSVINLETDLRKYPADVRAHLDKSMNKRRFQYTMQQELDRWLRTPRTVPDEAESPQGWYLEFGTSFTIFGRGQYIMTVGTEIERVNPKPAKPEEGLPRQVNLKEWWGIRQEPPPTDFDDFMRRWKSYTQEERERYKGIFPERFRHHGSLDDTVDAFLGGTPQPLDDGYTGLDPAPTSLDLP